MSKIRNKYSAIALGGIFALSMISCSKEQKSVEMGRYIEEYYNLPEGVNDVRDMRVLEDGSIGMLVYGVEEFELYISKDSCTTWEKQSLNLPKSDSENSVLSIDNAVLSNSGEVFISYYFYEYEEYEEGKDSEEADDKAEEIYTAPEEKYALIDSEGNINDVSLAEISENTTVDTEEEGYYGGYYYMFKFAENGNLIVSNDNGSIYQMDSLTGEIINEFTIDDEYISSLVTLGDSLVVIGDSAVKEYSLESGEEVGNIEALESEVLYQNNSNFYGIANIFSDDDKTFYYSNTTGLYKYVLGENSVEHIIEGSLSSLGDNNVYISSFMVNKDNEFLACANDYSSNESNTSLIHFYFSEDTPKVPENEITIYSLYDNYQMRQNIVLYQKAHPDVYIKMESGLTGDDAVTESDALRTLNTEIMAGKGPDIILLDGMSEAYLEQGLLEDISDVIEEYNKDGELFENIVDAYKDKDGKIYSVPTKFTMPVIAGKGEYVNSVSDLKTLSEALIKAASDVESVESDLKYTEMYTPSMLVSTLYYANGLSWLKDDGTINEENIKEFLEETKKVYEAYLATYDQEQYKEYLENIQSYSDESGEDLALYYVDNYFSPMSLMDEASIKLTTGVIYGFDCLEQMYSLNKENIDISYKLMAGQSSNTFVPKNLIGVNAKSKNKDDAKEFISYLLSEEIQSKDSYDGIPVNKAAFDASTVYPYADDFIGENGEPYSEEQSIGTWGFSSENGESVELKMYWPTKEYFEEFKKQVETLTTPITVNNIVLNEVAKAFDTYVNGEGSLDDVVKTINDNIDLILAE